MRERLIELLKEANKKWFYTEDKADHLLANGVVVLPEEDEGEEMRWSTVLKMLDEQYRKAKQESYVQKPMAYALRKTWIQVDRYEREKNRERRMKK